MVIIGKAKRPDISTHASGVVRNGLYAHPSPTNNSVSPGSYLRHTNADSSSGFNAYNSPLFRDRHSQKFTPSYMLPPSPTPGSIGSKKSFNAKASDTHIARNAWASVSMTSPRALHSPRHALSEAHLSSPRNPVSPSHQRKGRSSRAGSIQSSRSGATEEESKGDDGPQVFTFSKRDVRKSYTRPTYDKPTASALERTKGKVQVPFHAKQTTKANGPPRLRIQVPKDHGVSGLVVRVPSPKGPIVQSSETHHHGHQRNAETEHHEQQQQQNKIQHENEQPSRKQEQVEDRHNDTFTQHIKTEQHCDIRQAVEENMKNSVSSMQSSQNSQNQPRDKEVSLTKAERESVKRELVSELLREMKKSESVSNDKLSSNWNSLFGNNSTSTTPSVKDASQGLLAAADSLGRIGQMEAKRDILIRQLWERERNKQVMEERLERERREQIQQRRRQERQRLELLLNLEHERITKAIQRAEEIETMLINLAQAEAADNAYSNTFQKYAPNTDQAEFEINFKMTNKCDEVVESLDRQCDYLYREIRQVDSRLKGNQTQQTSRTTAWQPYTLDHAVGEVLK